MHQIFCNIVYLVALPLLLVPAQGHDSSASAQTFLIPQAPENKGVIYLTYPANQQYIYADAFSLPNTRQPSHVIEITVKAPEKPSVKYDMGFSEAIQKALLPKAVEAQQEHHVRKEESKAKNPPVLVLSTLFGFDSSYIKKSELQKLNLNLNKLMRADVIEIKGYTDKIGSKEYNNKLAIRRAEAVKQYLVSHGVNGSKIKIEGRGKCCYISQNNSENRRAEIWVEVNNGDIYIPSM